MMKAGITIIFRFFVSLRLTFVLLVCIGIGAVIGMSFDQTITFEDFYQNRSPGDASTFLVSFFELYDAFHSWWFSFALLLLAMNLIACSIERLPRIYFDYKRPRPYLTDRRLLGLQLKHSLKVMTKEEALSTIKTFMPIPLHKAKLKQAQGYYYAEKQGLSRFGVYIVHISLLIIMFSSIYATQNGVDGHVMIEEGQKARFITRRGAGGVSYIYDLGFYVGCDDFRLRTFVDNTPMEFESDLYISRDKKEKIAEKTVRVNEPLSFAGFTFYQSSFRPMVSERIVEIEVENEGGYKEKHRVRLMTPIELPNGETLMAEKIYEDFAGLGQALRIGKKNKDGAMTYFHIFRRHKDYDRLVRADQFSVTFLEVDQQYATGLSVGKMPGISLIFFGFMVLVAGLYMCFFMTPVRYFARLEEEAGHLIVWFAAQGYRNHSAVKDDFHKRLLSLPLPSTEANHV